MLPLAKSWFQSLVGPASRRSNLPIMERVSTYVIRVLTPKSSMHQRSIRQTPDKIGLLSGMEVFGRCKVSCIMEVFFP
jgi:hypothetical protein